MSAAVSGAQGYTDTTQVLFRVTEFKNEGCERSQCDSVVHCDNLYRRTSVILRQLGICKRDCNDMLSSCKLNPRCQSLSKCSNLRLELSRKFSTYPPNLMDAQGDEKSEDEGKIQSRMLKRQAGGQACVLTPLEHIEVCSYV